MTGSPTLGKFVSLFYLTRAGRVYLQRHRLQSMIKKVIRAAIIQAKLKTALFIAERWTWDTYKMEQSAITWINRCAFYDLGQTVGSDAEYAGYVFTLAKRLRVGFTDKNGKQYGPGQVHWTNPKMKTIEDDPLGETVKFAVKVFKETLNYYLNEIGLGWMTGRGRMPKHVEVLYNEKEKDLPRFHGSEKIIQWLQ